MGSFQISIQDLQQVLADRLGTPATPGRQAVCQGPAAAGTYHDGEAVVSLDTVLLTMGFGVLTAPQFCFWGEVQVVVHNLTPLHEEQGPVFVQNTLFVQVAYNFVGYLTGLQMETEGEGRKGALKIQIECRLFSTHDVTGTLHLQDKL